MDNLNFSSFLGVAHGDMTTPMKMVISDEWLVVREAMDVAGYHAERVTRHRLSAVACRPWRLNPPL